jgi:hypothetical protein
MRGVGERAESGGRYVELDRDRVADIAQRHGVDEREALILYHLGHAFELYFEIANEEDHGYDVDLRDWVDHHTGLVDLLMRRVVKRDHPGGWRTAGEIIAMRETERRSRPNLDARSRLLRRRAGGRHARTNVRPHLPDATRQRTSR